MDNKRQELNFIIIGWGIGVWIWITFILLYVGEFLLLISFVEFGDGYYKFDIVEYIFYIFIYLYIICRAFGGIIGWFAGRINWDGMVLYGYPICVLCIIFNFLFPSFFCSEIIDGWIY